MKKVIVAISGGVDSAVAAALLKRGWFLPASRQVDVIGAFMKLADLPIFREREKKARKVAKILKIPFLSFNFEKEFKKRIVDYFLKEYKAGRTPNPCVICNKKIKFGLLLKKALALDADFVATGHYVRLRKGKEGIHLLRGKDKTKEQSYFLWQLNQKQLKRILFPVGNYTKNQVRGLAKKLKLPVLRIPESMEICFIKTAINNFLKKYLKEKPGKIIIPEGKVVGEHQGLWFYTIGQRKGIKLAGGPYWVLEKDLNKNTLIITKREKDLYKKELRAKNVNWVFGKAPKLPLKIKAKIRYRHKAASATITHGLKSKVYNIKFSRSQRAVTPGQSVVFFRGEELVGGGIIC